MTTQTRAIAYLRISKDRGDRGVSLKDQRARVLAYADLYGIDLVEVIEESKSAKTMSRPGLERVLQMLESGTASAVLVLKLDRLTRNVSDLGGLISNYFAEGKQSQLMSVNEQIDTRTAGGRLVLNILGSVSQWERETISERTSAALQFKKSQGELVGSVPYGYQLSDNGVNLNEVPEEQAVISIVKRLRKTGLSLRKVAVELEKRGLRTRTNRRFLASQISRMAA